MTARPGEPGAPRGEEGEEAIDLTDISRVDSLAFILFWVLAGVVFLQFFTRYVLNDSLGWTEEIARYLLIGVTFVGAIIAVRKNTHIAVEFFYRYLPGGVRRRLRQAVAAANALFFAYMTWLAARLAGRTYQKMASIEVSKAVIYWCVAAACAVMTAYALRLAWRTFRARGEPAGTELPMKGID